MPDWRGLLETIEKAKGDLTAPNRFDNLDLFDFKDFQSQIGGLTDTQRNRTISSGNEAINQNRQATAERLASEGITGGSYAENALQGVTDAGQGQIADQLSGLDLNQLQAILQAMGQSNQTDLSVAQGGSNVDLANIANLLASRRIDAGTPDDTGNLLGSLLGGAAQVGSAALLASDRNLKENIVETDVSSEGLPIYEYNYIGAPEKRYRYYMAQDVEKVIPEAVTEVNGYKYLYPSKLTEQFREVANG